ncbi:MAG: hypothetical protein JNL97_11525 [Verrucomicrobiales bacterium]|nr:hypothetical protein [Verrucomicrobiales bacterium]
MNTPNRPANELRIGNIKAAVWRNENEGSVRFNVTFSRSYRDAEHWRSTDAFGRDDLLVLAKLADQAHTWICSQGRENRSESLASATRSESQASPTFAGDRCGRGTPAFGGRAA